MRVLQLIPSVNPASGGPIEGVLRQYAAIQKRGVHEWDIASLDGPSQPWVKECPVPVIALGSDKRFTFRYWKYVPWLRYGYASDFAPWLRANAARYDAIVVNGLWHYLDYACARILPELGIPYAVYSHGMLDPWFRRAYPAKYFFKQVSWWLAEGRLLRHAGAVLFTTEDERLLARGAYRPYRVVERVVGYGTATPPPATPVHVEAFRRSVPNLEARRYLLFLSRIHPKKGCDLLIEAFAAIAGRYPDLDLVLAGPDQLDWGDGLRAIAKRLGVGDRIHWPGMLSGDAKWGAFRAAEAFVLPSHQENFGIVVAEALATGTPALFSRRVNLWREVEEHHAGLTFEDTVAATTQALESFLASSVAERTTMTRNGVALFGERYEVTVAAERLMGALQELTQEPQREQTAT